MFTINNFRVHDASENAREGEPQKTYAISSVNLRLEHASKELGGMLWQGGSIEAIKLERSPHFGGVLGKGNFEWNAYPERSSFWYPFDQYTLLVNPTLVGQSAEGELFEKIYGLEIESRVPNLRLEVVRHGFAPSTDPYEIRLRRPIALRVVAIAVLLLAIVWLIYLMGYADIDSYISQIITSFLALWGIRTTLQAGVSVFPMAMDYFVLVFAIIVVGFTVPSWLITHLLKRTKQCVFCKKEVSETATRCPFCTSHI